MEGPALLEVRRGRLASQLHASSFTRSAMAATWNSFTRNKLRQNTARNHDPARGVSDLRATFIGACCGSIAEPHFSTSDRGLRIFAGLGEQRMREYETATSALLETLWKARRPTSPYIERQMETVTEIIRKMRAATAQTTIDDIAHEIFRYFAVPEDLSRQHQNAMRHLCVRRDRMVYHAVHSAFVAADADFSSSTLATVGRRVTNGVAKESFE